MLWRKEPGDVNEHAGRTTLGLSEKRRAFKLRPKCQMTRRNTSKCKGPEVRTGLVSQKKDWGQECYELKLEQQPRARWVRALWVMETSLGFLLSDMEINWSVKQWHLCSDLWAQQMSLVWQIRRHIRHSWNSLLEWSILMDFPGWGHDLIGIKVYPS